MSLRALIVCLLVASTACSSEGDQASEDARVQPSQQAVAFEDGAAISLLPNETRELVVRYTDMAGGPVANITVDFALTGSAPGASLTPPTVSTDENGFARTQLRVGGITSDLQVRARAPVEAVAFLAVSVRAALGVRVKVGLSYQGTRALSSYTVTSLPNMTCDQAMRSGAAGDVSYTFNSLTQTASFDLGYDVAVALVGWGRDSGGGTLARGCTQFRAPVTANQAEAQPTVTLPLSNTSLSLSDALALELELNVASSAKQLTAAGKRAAASVVSPDAGVSLFADADFVLDEVTAALNAQGNAAGASLLTARRAAQALPSSLQPALDAAAQGPTAYATATGAELTRRGASITLRWSLSSALQSTLQAFTALSADGQVALPFTALPRLEITPTFSADAATLSFRTLKIDLGLGAYGRTLLAGLDAGTKKELAERSGCNSALTTWWTRQQLTDIATVEAVSTACTAALAKLDAALEKELAALDAASSLSLYGSVQAHDRSDDGTIDDLGPSPLSGSWGSEPVQAQLRVPARTAFE